MALQSTTPLATITLQQATSTVTFSGIPNTYRDLTISISGTASTTTGARMVINSDSGSNYPWVRMYGTGSSGFSDSNTFTYGYIGDIFAAQTGILITLFDYSATDKHKTWLWRMDNSANYTMAGSGRWASNTAISTLQFALNSGTYSAGTTISLYGRIA
jgi:hypothetical protein